jgi:F0F1-type ATP synthase assembly protein I
MDPQNGGKGRRLGPKLASELGPFLTLGIQLAITVIAFFFIGQWLDSRLDTAPWLMLVGLAIGITGGLIKFFRTAIQIGKQSESDKEEKS